MKIYVKAVKYNIRNGVIPWQCMTVCLMAVIMFAPSLTIYDTFANQIKCQKFDLENKGQGTGERYLCRSTGTVPIQTDEFLLRILDNL